MPKLLRLVVGFSVLLSATEFTEAFQQIATEAMRFGTPPEALGMGKPGSLGWGYPLNKVTLLGIGNLSPFLKGTNIFPKMMFGLLKGVIKDDIGWMEGGDLFLKQADLYNLSMFS